MNRLSRLESNSTMDLAEINLSPLIDMVFLLLIFFMVTTVFVEETGVAVDKPTATSAVNLEKHSLLLAITRSGQVVYGGHRLSLNGVRGLVARKMRETRMPVIILADRGCPSGTLVDVLDECKLGGAPKVSIAADIK